MEFNKALNESYKRYNLKYEGTREDYEIHDPEPYVLALDQNYNADGNGLSILGLNLNYYKGDKKKLIKIINDFDNKNGYRGFEGKLKIKQLLKTKDIDEWEADKRKKRYDSLMKEYPFLKQYVRRYKQKGPKGTGIKSQKRKRLK